MHFWSKVNCYILVDEAQVTEKIWGDEDDDSENWTNGGPWDPRELEFKQVLVKGCREEASDPIKNYYQLDIP